MPVVAVIWGILDGEELTMNHLIGGILILLGVYLIQLKVKKNKDLAVTE